MPYNLEQIGITSPGIIRRNWPIERLVEHELAFDGGKLGPRGTVMVDTGILAGDIEQTDFMTDPVFGTEVPLSLPGVEAAILQPRDTWPDKAAYDETAGALAAKFHENFNKYADAQADLVSAGPEA